MDYGSGMMTCLPEAGFVSKLVKRWALRQTLRWLVASSLEAAAAAKNVELGFWCLSFVWDSLGRWDLEKNKGVGGGMGLPRLCRGEPEAPTKH